MPPSRKTVVNIAVAEAFDDQSFDVLGVEQQVLDRDPLLGFGQPDRDAVVAPQDLHVEPGVFGHAGLDRHRPWGVHPRTERRQHARAVAELVGEALDDDRAVVGDDAGRVL